MMCTVCMMFPSEMMCSQSVLHYIMLPERQYIISIATSFAEGVNHDIVVFLKIIRF